MMLLGSAFYALLMAVLTFLTLRRPHLALVGVLTMFGLEQLGQIYIPFLRTHGAFTNIYVLLLLGIAVALTFRSGGLSVGFTYNNIKIRAFSIALYLYAFLSLAWAPDGSQVGWEKAWPYLIANMALAPVVISRIEHLHEIQKAFIWLGGLLVLFLAIVPEWGARSPLIAGTTEDLGIPLSMAQMSGYLLITALVHLKKNHLSIVWLSVVVLGSLIVAIKTGSRGQLIFALVSFVLVIPLMWKRFSLAKALQLAIMVALIVLIIVYIFDQLGARTGRWQTNTMIGDLVMRFDHASILLAEWINTPYAIVFGLGNSASSSADLIGGYPHIVLLEVLGEEGIIGFILFVVVILLSVRRAYSFRVLTALSTDLKKTYAASFGCFLFTLLLSFKQGSLLNSSVIFLFAVMSEKYFYLVKRSIFQYQKSAGLARDPILLETTR